MHTPHLYISTHPQTTHILPTPPHNSLSFQGCSSSLTDGLADPYKYQAGQG